MKYKFGIELHVLLDTKKLFCNCNYNFYQNNLSNQLSFFPFIRKKDILAQLYTQYSRYNYLFNDLSCCNYEQDDSFPYYFNIPTQLFLLAAKNKLEFLPETYCFRKRIFDGSIPSGYQKTMRVFYPTKMDLGSQKPTLFFNLEEDSAGRIGNNWVLSRLGRPLLEITTSLMYVSLDEIVSLCYNLGQKFSYFFGFRERRIFRQDINLGVDNIRIEFKGIENPKKIISLLDSFFKKIILFQSYSKNDYFEICNQKIIWKKEDFLLKSIFNYFIKFNFGFELFEDFITKLFNGYFHSSFYYKDNYFYFLRPIVSQQDKLSFDSDVPLIEFPLQKKISYVNPFSFFEFTPNQLRYFSNSNIFSLFFDHIIFVPVLFYSTFIDYLINYHSKIFKKINLVQTKVITLKDILVMYFSSQKPSLILGDFISFINNNFLK